MTLLATAKAQMSIAHDDFKVNNLGQILTISEHGIDLYSTKGTLLKHYSEDLLGIPSSIDRSSSLESLIFYDGVPGFQLLDNTLSPHSPLYDLNQNGQPNVTAVCLSNDNSFWAYDAVSFELFRFDDTFEVLERSGNLAVITGQELAPISVSISGNRVYMAEPDQGILVFDLFANYLMTLTFDAQILSMDVTEKYVYAHTTEGLSRSDKKGFSVQQWNKKEEALTCFDVELGMLYWGDGKSIQSASLNSLFD